MALEDIENPAHEAARSNARALGRLFEYQLDWMGSAGLQRVFCWGTPGGYPNLC